MKIHQKLTPISRLLCYHHDAFIIGGAVPYLIGETDVKPKDIDIIVHPDKFRTVMMIMASKPREDFDVNSFGGFKIKDEGFTLDIWPDTIERFILENIKIKVVFPKTGTVIKMEALPN